MKKVILILFLIIQKLFCFSQDQNYTEFYIVDTINSPLIIDSIPKFYETFFSANCTILDKVKISLPVSVCSNSQYFIYYWQIKDTIFSRLEIIKNKSVNKYCYEEKNLIFYDISKIKENNIYVDFNQIALYYKSKEVEKNQNEKFKIELKNFIDYFLLTKNVDYSKIISSNDNYELSEIWGTLINPKNEIFEKAKILKKLNLDETKNLINDLISIDYLYKNMGEYDCSFDPHEAIVFYNKENQIISVLELCFVCGEISFNFLPRKFDMKNPMSHYTPSGNFYSICSLDYILKYKNLDKNLTLLLNNAQIRKYQDKIDNLK